MIQFHLPARDTTDKRAGHLKPSTTATGHAHWPVERDRVVFCSSQVAMLLEPGCLSGSSFPTARAHTNSVGQQQRCHYFSSLSGVSGPFKPTGDIKHEAVRLPALLTCAPRRVVSITLVGSINEFGQPKHRNTLISVLLSECPRLVRWQSLMIRVKAAVEATVTSEPHHDNTLHRHGARSAIT